MQGWIRIRARDGERPSSSSTPLSGSLSASGSSSPEALPDLTMTVDTTNTMVLHTVATQGHIEVVNLLVETDGSLALIAKSNGKTTLHSAARNGHLEVVKAILNKEPGIIISPNKKGQTALHMTAKGTSVEIVDKIINCKPTVATLVDTKGNTASHIAARKDRPQVLIGSTGALSLVTILSVIIGRTFQYVLSQIQARVVANLRGCGKESAAILLWVHIFVVFSMVAWNVLYFTILF